MMINCVSTNSSGRQQYGKILYMVRGTQDFLNILNKNNAKIAISQGGGSAGGETSTNGSVGKIVLASLGSESQIEQQHEGIVRLENTESVLKNGQLILKNIDKSHSVLLIRSTPAATATSVSISANDSSTPQSEQHTNMSIETLDTMEANSSEDNNENTVVTASTQKIGAASLVNSGK